MSKKNIEYVQIDQSMKQ